MAAHPIPDAALDADIAILGKRVGSGVTPTASDCAYAAGFIDGEGNICIVKNNNGTIGCVGPTFNMRIMANNDEIEPLVWLRERWGGSIRARKPRPNGKVHHSWYCFSRQAVVCLTDLLPYLIIKKQRAVLALKFQRSIHLPPDGKRHPTEYREMLNAMRNEMLALNGYGERAGVL